MLGHLSTLDFVLLILAAVAFGAATLEGVLGVGGRINLVGLGLLLVVLSLLL